MSSVLVAGRVDEDIARRAGALIDRSGLTTSEVIRLVWGNIAATGQLPKDETAAAASPARADSRLRALRAKTPTSQRMASLGPDELREELGNRAL